MSYLSGPNRPADPVDFRRTYSKLSQNLDKLQFEVDKNRRLAQELDRQDSRTSSKPEKPENIKRTPQRSPGLNSNQFKTHDGRIQNQGRSQNHRAENADRNSSANRHFQQPSYSSASRHVADRYGSSFEADQGFSSQPDRFVSAQDEFENLEDLKGMHDDILDIKRKLNQFVTTLHMKEDKLKNDLEYIVGSPAASGGVHTRPAFVDNSSRNRSKSRPTSSSPKRYDSNAESYKSSTGQNNYYLKSSYIDEVDAQPSPKKHFETRYEDIGGNPNFYPEQDERFNSSIDYRGHLIPRMRDSPKQSAERQDRRNRSPAGSEQRSFASHKQPVNSDTLNYEEIDNHVQNCKVKRNILKNRLDIAEGKLKDLLKAQNFQRELEIQAELNDQEAQNQRESNKYSKLIQKERDRSVEEFEKLTRIKQDRSIQNHNLNQLKKRIDKMRLTESQLEKQTKLLMEEDQKIEVKLITYEDLIKENLELKSRLRRVANAANQAKRL